MRTHVEFKVGDFVKKDIYEMGIKLRPSIRIAVPTPIDYLWPPGKPYPLEMRVLTFILNKYDERKNIAYYVLEGE